MGADQPDRTGPLDHLEEQFIPMELFFSWLRLTKYWPVLLI